MSLFNDPKLKRILETDELDLASLGTGVHGDGVTKTALFCVIPDNDKTYNFMAGILYSLMFQELYYQADFLFDGELPIPVSIYMDEFANVALPDDFISLESTMRSRNIDVSIIVQNLAQVKALFKDTWETITGNADIFIYLGGSTFEYVSKMLGSETIDKSSTSEQRGQHGHLSRSQDRMQHTLLAPDEVRKMPSNRCIIMIRGEDPIFDRVYSTFSSTMYRLAAGLGNYVHDVNIKRGRDGKIIKEQIKKKEAAFTALSQSSMEYYKKISQNDDSVLVRQFSLADFVLFDESTVYENVVRKFNEEPEEIEDDFPEYRKPLSEEKRKTIHTVIEGILQHDLNAAQRLEVIQGYQDGLDDEEILKYLDPAYTAEEMKERRLIIMKYRYGLYD